MHMIEIRHGPMIIKKINSSSMSWIMIRSIQWYNEDEFEDLWWEYQFYDGYWLMLIWSWDSTINYLEWFIYLCFMFCLYICRVLVLCGSRTIFLFFYSQKVAQRLFERYCLVFSYYYTCKMPVMVYYTLRL